MSAPFLTEEQVRQVIGPDEALVAVRKGFIQLARGQAIVPAAMGFEVGSERGEVHVKAAYLHDTPYYSVKIASGFYANAARGLPVSDGLIAVFDAHTGQLGAMLLDNGYLTELRTAAAGALAADLLARRDARNVAIIGSGSQARYQLDALRRVREIGQVRVYGRSPDGVQAYAHEMSERFNLNMVPAESVRDAVKDADIVVTTTPSRAPLVEAQWIKAGTLLIAVESDGPGKQELDSLLLDKADKLIVDHRQQCLLYGEVQHILSRGDAECRIHAELGEVAAALEQGRSHDDEIIVADLTGVGVQDAAVANHVLNRAIEIGLLSGST